MNGLVRLSYRYTAIPNTPISQRGRCFPRQVGLQHEYKRLIGARAVGFIIQFLHMILRTALSTATRMLPTGMNLNLATTISVTRLDLDQSLEVCYAHTIRFRLSNDCACH
jgi:hypothetical protein